MIFGCFNQFLDKIIVYQAKVAKFLFNKIFNALEMVTVVDHSIESSFKQIVIFIFFFRFGVRWDFSDRKFPFNRAKCKF